MTYQVGTVILTALCMAGWHGASAQPKWHDGACDSTVEFYTEMVRDFIAQNRVLQADNKNQGNTIKLLQKANTNIQADNAGLRIDLMAALAGMVWLQGRSRYTALYYQTIITQSGFQNMSDRFIVWRQNCISRLKRTGQRWKCVYQILMSSRSNI
jgi:hypothetical protein